MNCQFKASEFVVKLSEFCTEFDEIPCKSLAIRFLNEIGYFHKFSRKAKFFNLCPLDIVHIVVEIEEKLKLFYPRFDIGNKFN